MHNSTPSGAAPRIAITATTRADSGACRVRLNDAYVRSVERSGGVPLIIPPLRSPEHVSRALDGVDGLLLTGGEDVAPSRYGAEPHPTVDTLHHDRDATEIALVEAARARRMPTLAICRGIQLLNVALGGSLIQDIPSERPSGIAHDVPGTRAERSHAVRVDAQSHLASILGTTHLVVNSFHHQAVDRLAEGLRATAWADDGVIEGAEWAGSEWWAVAVQWHPEELTEDDRPWDRSLFAAFVRRATTPTSSASRRAPGA
jgi:putative glutamine amidotransferase